MSQEYYAPKDYPEVYSEDSIPTSESFEPVDAVQHRTAIPVIIVACLGGAFTIYAAVGPNIPQTIRIFSILVLLLWTILWSLILYVLHKDKYIETSYWMLFLALIPLIYFFIVVVILQL